MRILEHSSWRSSHSQVIYHVRLCNWNLKCPRSFSSLFCLFSEFCFTLRVELVHELKLKCNVVAERSGIYLNCNARDIDLIFTSFSLSLSLADELEEISSRLFSWLQAAPCDDRRWAWKTFCQMRKSERKRDKIFKLYGGLFCNRKIELSADWREDMTKFQRLWLLATFLSFSLSSNHRRQERWRRESSRFDKKAAAN